jgi:HEAT repeat protein
MRRAFQWGMILVLCRDAAAGEEEMVWRLFRLADGSSFTARLIDDQEDSFTISYSGSILQVAKRDVMSVSVAAPDAAQEKAAEAEPAKPWTREPMPPDPSAAPAAARSAGVPDERLFRAAIEDLAAEDESRTPQAFLLLGAHLGRARPLLHQALQSRDRKLRGKVLRLLGAMGNARDDLPALATGLADPERWVRLAAVQAIRALGPEAPVTPGHPAVEPPGAPRDLRLVEVLVEHFLREKDREVREVVRGALEELTGKKLGMDPAAWRTWLLDEKGRGDVERILGLEGVTASDR